MFLFSYTVHLGPNLEFDTPQLRLVYSTPVDPPRVLSYHVRSYEVKVLRSIGRDLIYRGG